MDNSGDLQTFPVPHSIILSMPMESVERLSVEEKMRMVRDIRTFIGARQDAWHAKGWAGEALPPDERRIVQQAEEIGIKLFDGMGIPASYWRNSEAELNETLQRLEVDPEMRTAARQWSRMSRDEQRVVLQKAVAVMAEEQTKRAPVKIFPGIVDWVEGASFEGNSSADYKDPPEGYKIELNGDERTGCTAARKLDSAVSVITPRM